jgi:hypothetical protein
MSSSTVCQYESTTLGSDEEILAVAFISGPKPERVEVRLINK